MRMQIIEPIILSFVLCSLSYAYPDISINLKSTANVMPDVYKLSINITYQAKTDNDVINYLGKVDKKIRNLKLHYRGGNFKVFQNCFYSDNKYMCKGYKGTDKYKFYLKNPDRQKEIFNALKDINYQIVYSGFIVPEKQVRIIKKRLIANLAIKSIKYATKFSKIYHKNCYVKSISYISNIPRSVMFSAAMAKVSLPLPRISKEKISMQASVNIACKN